MGVDETQVIGVDLIGILRGDIGKGHGKRVVPAQVDDRTRHDGGGASPQAALDARELQQIAQSLFERSAVGLVFVFLFQPKIDMVFHARILFRWRELCRGKMLSWHALTRGVSFATW